MMYITSSGSLLWPLWRRVGGSLTGGGTVVFWIVLSPLLGVTAMRELARLLLARLCFSGLPMRLVMQALRIALLVSTLVSALIAVPVLIKYKKKLALPDSRVICSPGPGLARLGISA